jgi:hypothetical protein
MLRAFSVRIALEGGRFNCRVMSTQRLETAARVTPWRFAMLVMLSPL